MARLDLCCRVAFGAHHDVGSLGERAVGRTGERQHAYLERPRHQRGVEQVGRSAARADGQQGVAGPAQPTQLLGQPQVAQRHVVVHRGRESAVRPEHDHSQALLEVVGEHLSAGQPGQTIP